VTLSVRLAAPADLDAVVALDPGHADWLARALAGEHDRVARVALLDGEVVGFAVVGAFFGHRFLELIRTAEPHLRQGVASALMAEIEAAFEGDRLFVSTNESNSAMRTLLAARDYKVSGIVENLDPGDPELFFVKFRPTPA
jgi:GNAT superfamily N-acetyltransferase